MQDILIVVDMQNDFIDGSLGTAEAVLIVPRVAEKIRSFPGTVLFTRDTHGPDYLNTQEGRKLPVVHCVKGRPGWEIREELAASPLAADLAAMHDEAASEKALEAPAEEEPREAPAEEEPQAEPAGGAL